MTQAAPHDLVVVGAGMAGCSAALWAARLELRLAWLEAAPALGGQLRRVHSAIPDYPAFEARDGAGFIAALRAQLQRAGLAPRLGSEVAALEPGMPAAPARTGLAAVLRSGERVRAATVLLCTGLVPRTLGLAGEGELLGISSSASRERERVAGADVVIAGGGDGGVENALIATAAGARRVTLVHRHRALQARQALQERLSPAVEVLLESEIVALEGREQLDAVRVRTPAGERRIPARWLFLKLGFAPAAELARPHVALGPGGAIPVDRLQRTERPGLYAAGDVCLPRHASLAAAAGQAMVAVKTIGDALI